MKIILASNSPRRQELLKLLNVPFDVVPANIQERLNDNLTISEQIEQIALTKARNIANSYPEALVIGADTVVVINNQILGKPKDETDAKKMISLLQNNRHQVITAVAIIKNKITEVFHEITEVSFYAMSEQEITDYVKDETIYDKAGAYAIQGKAALYIEAIHGDFYNVMGLPIAKLKRHVSKYY